MVSCISPKRAMNFKTNMQQIHLFSLLCFSLSLGYLSLWMLYLDDKWLVVFLATLSVLCLCAMVNAAKRILEALLILSLAVDLDIRLFYSETYGHPGFPVSLTFITLLALYVIRVVRMGFDNKLRVHVRPATFCLILLTILSLGSIWWATETQNVLYGFAGMLTAFLLFLYLSNQANSTEDLLFFLKGGALTIILTTLIGIVQYLNGPLPGLEFLGSSSGAIMFESGIGAISRVSGFLRHPNSLAWLLIAWLPIFAAFALVSRQPRLTGLTIAAFVCGLLTLLLTSSRGGWISFLASAVFFLFLVIKRTFRRCFSISWKQVLTLGLLGGLIVLLLFPQIKERIASDDYGAAYSRLPMMRVAGNVIAENPYLGVGYKNYIAIMEEYDTTPTQITAFFPYPVHNMYLHVGAELGVIGLACLILFCVFILLDLRKCLQETSRVKIIVAAGLLASLLAQMLQGMVEPFGDIPWRIFCFFAGLSVGLPLLGKSTDMPGLKSILRQKCEY